MLSILTIKIPESMKAEIETLVEEMGLWENRSEFIREAIDKHIKEYWNGNRFEH